MSRAALWAGRAADDAGLPGPSTQLWKLAEKRKRTKREGAEGGLQGPSKQLGDSHLREREGTLLKDEPPCKSPIAHPRKTSCDSPT